MGGYKTLLVYRTAVQMHHAARSGKQNIAEGSKELSTASDITLNSVSRSSYTELAEDYEDFLRLRRLPIWDKNDPRVVRIRTFRESSDVPTNLTDLANWAN